MNKGWIKLHRQLTDNPIWHLEPFTKGQAWVDLFLNANHKSGIIDIRGNIVEIKRGQIGWSELTMSKRWRWSRNKTRRYLKWLETIQQIEQQKLYKLTTITTILNYDKYQNDTTDDTTEGQQKVHKQELKNEKNEKKERGRFTPPSLQEIQNYIKEKNYTTIDPLSFISFYESKGWKVGKVEMRNWRAALTGWEARSKKENKKRGFFTS